MGPTSTSPVPGEPPEAVARHVYFEACFNFRDLGGYGTADGRRLRWRTLYRSDTLHRLTDVDLETFGALGVRTVMDLRSKTEVEDYGRLRDGRHGVDWHHLPMLDDLRLRPPTPGEQARSDVHLAPAQVYIGLLDAYSSSVASVFHLLAADGGLPAVFHCTGGKDRTGIVAALVLDLCGVDAATIAADYMLTAESRHRSTAWINEHEPEFAAMIAALPPERKGIRRDAILGLLERVRERWGSTAGFLDAVGIADDERAALVARLVE